MKPRWSTGLVAVVGLLAVVGLAACRGGDRAELPLAGPPVRVDRIDRCTVRVLPATQEEREAFESAVRARLGDLGVERLELGPRGASVRSFVVSGAPVPPAAPANPQQADELATAALARYGAVFGLSPGAVPQAIMIPAFLVLGTLIGTRFAGMPQAQFFGSLAAGLAVTVIAVAMAGAAAVPVARALGMPAPHVLTAFAPGGLETMVALGATMGASPGFVAACHVARLLVLSLLIPLSLGRSGARS